MLGWRNASVRAIRTFFQTLAGLMIGIPSAQSVLDIHTAVTSVIPLILWASGVSAVVAFAQNIAESATGVNVPK